MIWQVVFHRIRATNSSIIKVNCQKVFVEISSAKPIKWYEKKNDLKLFQRKKKKTLKLEDRFFAPKMLFFQTKQDN